MAREPTEHPVQGAAAGPMSFPRLGGSSSSSWNKCGASAPRPCAPPPPPAGEGRPSGFQQSCWLVMLWGAEQSAGKADSLVSVLVTVRESPPCRGRKSS